jgi:hypothetical protein
MVKVKKVFNVPGPVCPLCDQETLEFAIYDDNQKKKENCFHAEVYCTKEGCGFSERSELICEGEMIDQNEAIKK